MRVAAASDSVGCPADRCDHHSRTRYVIAVARALHTALGSGMAGGSHTGGQHLWSGEGPGVPVVSGVNPMTGRVDSLEATAALGSTGHAYALMQMDEEEPPLVRLHLLDPMIRPLLPGFWWVPVLEMGATVAKSAVLVLLAHHVEAQIGVLVAIEVLCAVAVLLSRPFKHTTSFVVRVDELGVGSGSPLTSQFVRFRQRRLMWSVFLVVALLVCLMFVDDDARAAQREDVAVGLLALYGVCVACMLGSACCVCTRCVQETQSTDPLVQSMHMPSRYVAACVWQPLPG